MNDLMRQVMQDYGQYLNPQAGGIRQMAQKYAEGGEVEDAPYDISAFEQNPLLAMRQMELMAEAGQEAPVSAPMSMPASSQALMRRRDLMDQLTKAIDEQKLPSGVSDAEKYWRLAAAFAKPGKTGSFGEGLGYAAESMAEVEAAKRAAAKEATALGLQKLQTKMQLAEQDYSLSKEQEMRDLLGKYMTMGADTVQGAAAGARGPAASIPPNIRALIATMSPDKAITTIIEWAREQGKPSDLQRGINALVSVGHITEEQGNQMLEEGLRPKFEKIEVDVPNLGGTVEMSATEARKYFDSGELPTRLSGKPAATTETAPAEAPAAAPAKPLTKQQIAAQEKALTKRAELEEEATQDFFGTATAAKDQMTAAREVSAIAKNNPAAFGILADPTAANAFLSLVDTGVQTPWGSFGVPMDQFVSKLKLTGPDAKAQQLALRPIYTIEVGFRKMFLKGEGAVSNMEGALAKYVGPQLSDNAQVAMTKAGMIQIGAERRLALADALRQERARDPSMSLESFKGTPMYKKIDQAFDKKYMDFAQQAGIPMEKLDVAPTSTKSGGYLDIIRQERKRRSGGQ